MRSAAFILFFHQSVEPLLDQTQHASVHYAHPHAGHQLVVRDAVEVTFQVCIIDSAAACREVLADDFQRIVRAPSGPKPVGAVQEVRFENRIQD